jgi:adenosylhomocysteine nucleosidase
MECVMAEPTYSANPGNSSGGSIPRLTAIVAAMPAELAPLVHALRCRETTRLSFGRAHRGTLGGTAVVLAATGEGRDRAFRGATELLEAHPAERLIVVGTSGGLSVSLEPGALIVASRVQDGGGPESQPNAAWYSLALDLGGATGGTVLCSDRILGSAADKRAAAGRLRADEPAVVDLESAAYTEAATVCGIPWLVVRAVCDTADDDLPFDIETCRRLDGTINRLSVVRRAVASPRAIRELWQLRQRVALGSKRLAEFVGRLIAEEQRVRS